jgi:hypothetical protein
MAGGVAQMTDLLPSTCRAWVQTPVPKKKKKKIAVIKKDDTEAKGEQH